jgi:hypothetical protein
MESTNYQGIDYGNGLTNLNPKTKIRFGVIHQNHVPFFHEEATPYYDGIELECGECNHDYVIKDNDSDCPECGANTNDDVDPLAWAIDSEEIKAECSQDDVDIFVFESQYYTYAQFCSPCAPGACYLTSPLDFKNENNKTCFGPTWFEGKPPYPIYEVSTGRRVG